MSPENVQPGASNKCVLKSKEGETCGLWGSTGQTLPDCASDLFCMSPEDGLLGAPNKCVPRSKKGQACEGFNESTAQPHPDCAEGLECKASGEVTIPGAGKTCVAGEFASSGSLFGLTLTGAIGLVGLALI